MDKLDGGDDDDGQQWWSTMMVNNDDDDAVYICDLFKSWRGVSTTSAEIDAQRHG